MHTSKALQEAVEKSIKRYKYLHDRGPRRLNLLYKISDDSVISILCSELILFGPLHLLFIMGHPVVCIMVADTMVCNVFLSDGS
jgi:hypothetical protein